MPRWPKGSTGNVRKDAPRVASFYGVEVQNPDGSITEFTTTPLGSSDSKAAEAPAGNPADAGANPVPTTKYVAIHEETTTPMKIQFTTVTLHKDVARLDAGKGLASHTTRFFNTAKAKGLTLEYDTATCFLRIALGPIAIYVPRDGVEWFGPTLDDAEAMAKASDAKARANAAAQAQAQAEAEAIAQRPA